MADRIALMLEAERRGILPADKVALLKEARKRGLVPGQPEQPVAAPEPSVGGAGGFNPMLSLFGGGALATGESLGMTPENTASPVRNALAPAEAAAQLATASIAAPLAGIAGLAQGAKNLFGGDGISAADRISQVQEGLTYQPRTGAGAGMSKVAAAPIDVYAQGTNYLGEKVAEATGSPALGAAVKTIGDVAPAVAGARGQKRPAPRPSDKYTPKPEPGVPTTEQLTSAAKEAYKAGKESGIVVPADSYAKALAAVKGVAKNEGISSKLHPKTSALLEHLDESAGKDLTITEAENLRRVIQEVAGDLDPATRKPTADAFRASKMLDVFDEAVDQLSVNSDARALWSRSRKSQMLDDMIERAHNRAGANYTQAGMETAIRQEFKQLLQNPRRMRGFTKEQKAAIAKVVRGGPVENSLRVLGKFDPTTGGMGTAVSLVTAGSLAPVTGGASAALPVIGFGAKRLATRATSKNVDAAREALVGRGLPNAAPRATAPTTQSAAAVPATSEAAATQSRATARTPEVVQADIEHLARTAQQIPKTPSGAAQMAAIRLRLALLERELAEMPSQSQAAQ